MKATSVITLQITCVGDFPADPLHHEEVAKRLAEVVENTTNVDDVTVVYAKVFVHAEEPGDDE